MLGTSSGAECFKCVSSCNSVLITTPWVSSDCWGWGRSSNLPGSTWCMTDLEFTPDPVCAPLKPAFVFHASTLQPHPAEPSARYRLVCLLPVLRRPLGSPHFLQDAAAVLASMPASSFSEFYQFAKTGLSPPLRASLCPSEVLNSPSNRYTNCWGQRLLHIAQGLCLNVQAKDTHVPQKQNKTLMKTTAFPTLEKILFRRTTCHCKRPHCIWLGCFSLLTNQQPQALPGMFLLFSPFRGYMQLAFIVIIFIYPC